MRDPKRIRPLLDRLEIIWNRCSDQRLGQLIHNASWHGSMPDAYNMECEELILNLEDLFDIERNEE